VTYDLTLCLVLIQFSVVGTSVKRVCPRGGETARVLKDPGQKPTHETRVVKQIGDQIMYTQPVACEIKQSIRIGFIGRSHQSHCFLMNNDDFLKK
jgi:hypothetical protein